MGIPALTPFSLDVLLGRIANEWETRQRIFDLPTARFWKKSDDADLSMEFLGRPAATPVGPGLRARRPMQAHLTAPDIVWIDTKADASAVEGDVSGPDNESGRA